jgi:molecular chaperone GrpE
MTKPDKHSKPQNPQPPSPENASPAAGDIPAPQNGQAVPGETAPEGAAAPEAAQEPLVGLTLAEYTQLQDRAEQSEQKAKEYFEGWQRERADFANYRRRMERDSATLQQNLTGTIIKRYLVVLDDLDRALKARPTQGEGAAWSEGVELIARKLSSILDMEGVKIISADGAQFDPVLHEAISHENSPDHHSGQVIEVVQRGYMIGDRVLRPALVRVAQ